MLSDAAKAAAKRLRALIAVKGAGALTEFYGRPLVAADLVEVVHEVLQEIPDNVDDPLTEECLLGLGYTRVEVDDPTEKFYVSEDAMVSIDSGGTARCSPGTYREFLTVITVGELLFLTDFFSIPRDG